MDYLKLFASAFVVCCRRIRRIRRRASAHYITHAKTLSFFISLPNFDISAVMAVSHEGPCSVRRAGRMTCTRPAALTWANPRAHWPKVSVAWGEARMSIWALKGATHCRNRAPAKSPDSDSIGPLRGPFLLLPAFPRPHEVLRPVRPGVNDSQGRWPCAGLQPAKLFSDTNSFMINSIR